MIDLSNQVWASDITYIPVRHGFLYLAVIMDWTTRKILSWRGSNTLHADFCAEALQEAIEKYEKYEKPEIMNTDQGNQFTSEKWIKPLKEATIQISIDGQGRYLDNIFVERLWRSLKPETIYLHEINNGFQANKLIKDWVIFYNRKRPHSVLAYRTLK